MITQPEQIISVLVDYYKLKRRIGDTLLIEVTEQYGLLFLALTRRPCWYLYPLQMLQNWLLQSTVAELKVLRAENNRQANQIHLVIERVKCGQVADARSYFIDALRCRDRYTEVLAQYHDLMRQFNITHRRVRLCLDSMSREI